MDYKSFQPGGQEQKPVTPPVTQMPSKTFTPKFIWVVAALLVLGGTAYAGIWFWNDKNKEAVAPTFTPRPDPMADWKTYRNEEYGFEIQMPREYVPELTKNSLIIWSDPGKKHNRSDNHIEFTKESRSLKEILGDSGSFPGARVYGGFGGPESYNVKVISYFTGDAYTINRLYVFAKDYPTSPGDDGSETKGVITARVEAGISEEEMRLAIDAGVTDFGNHQYLIEQVLNSFKFISTPINSFQSCADAGYPIMESYPEKCRTPDGLTFTKYDACIQVIARARNPQTGETRDFPTPCDVPEGWEPVNS